MSKKIINGILMALSDIPGVGVTTHGNTVHITHAHHHVAQFVFKWSVKHYIGYFVDGNGGYSQAIVTLDTILDAGKFAGIYAQLCELRASRWL